jgi:hypothetical protein
MRWRVLIWLLLSGTVGVVVWCWFGHRGGWLKPTFVVTRTTLPTAKVPSAVATESQSYQNDVEAKSTTRINVPHRLSNTAKSLAELMRSPTALLLENALLDTSSPLNLPIPENLRIRGDPGGYIVQSRGEFSDSFRQSLDRLGAIIIAYIPNNAYLVRIAADKASLMADDPEVRAVLPLEPYYKFKGSLLDVALNEASLPSELLSVSLLLFDEGQQSTTERIRDAGIDVLTQSHSPFGIIATVRCSGASVAWLARLPGVQELERSRSRVSASDLTRARLGVAVDPTINVNYLGLTGSNVLVNVNDLGVDFAHPDLAGRVVSDQPNGSFDKDGHGTFIAGLIAGNGGQSLSVASAPGSQMPPAAFQFRGLAPSARIFSIALDSNSRTLIGDDYLQQTPALHQALISNNSWHYADDSEYDLGAAGYDAAVRDALPSVSGSQPLLCVFAAGNKGGGDDDGSGGIPDGIQSPGTAKNVITVGAIEQPRWIHNQVWDCATNGQNVSCLTNTPWLPLTDSSNQVAGFSSRGNVGHGTEGISGRFKPDVVAPGTFVVSTRSTTWDQYAYYSASNNCLGLSTDGNYYQVLSNLNTGLGPFYRFESGTSLAAANVSGILALMQEFFERRLLRTNSPALMKALLINGARSLQSGYDVHSSGATNFQGWGVVQLPNTLPGALTNPGPAASSMWLFDQSPLEALPTGRRRSRFVALSPSAQTLPLRATLVWTDPPGNPLAGVKLVNDLDLIVTNLETGEVFFGNDIPAGTSFNSPWKPGSAPNLDMVNNVENIYLSPPLGSNYSVTVLGRRIGVNAVSEFPDGVAQDYALVISSGDGQLTNALSLTDVPVASRTTSVVTPVINSFATAASDFGAVLFNQSVGSGAPSLATNSFVLPGSTNAVATVGIPNQWHFYVFTNNTSFSNAVFLTFQAQPLSLIPGGVAPSAPGLLWSATADLDLYVSRDPGLTNLNPAVLAAADMSLGRGGSETIVYSNATPGVYYIGIKCESLQGAQYGFLADVSQQPFAQIDSIGNEILRGFPEPAVLPSGTMLQPGESFLFYVTPDIVPIRRVVATNVLSYASLRDLQLTLTHASSSVVLYNHSATGSSAAKTFVNDDSGEGDIPAALPSDGPGSLRQFSGSDGSGQWLLTMTTTNQPGTNQNSALFLELQQDLAGTVAAAILPGICREDFVNVPMQSTNLTAVATLISGTGPISLEIYPSSASASNCASLIIAGTGANGVVTSDQFSQPPLNPGPYIIRTCNLGPDAADVTLQASVTQGALQSSQQIYTSTAQISIPDNALSSSTLSVTNTDPILSVEVGMRIEWARWCLK